jgi:hypothetical protein
MTGWKHGKLMSCAPALVILLWAGQRGAQAQLTTTTIQDTVYSANGNAAVGTVIVSWPAFATAANGTVAAGSTTVTIGADGFLSLNLAPNAGATPAGTYYTVVYHLSDGTVSKEFWLVPAVAQTTISGIRTQVTPAAVAMLTASKAYVDSSIAGLSGTYVAVDGGSMTGPLVLSGDPAAASQASTKHYVDAQISTLAGTIGSGTDTNAIHSNTAGPQSVEGALAAAALTAPLLNHVAYADQFATVQLAVTAACAASPIEMVVIPNAVALATTSPEFTNPCGARVLDQRVAHTDVFDVRSYGAVCSGGVDDTAALQAAINAASSNAQQFGGISAQVQLPNAVCRGNVTLPAGVSLNGHYGSRAGTSQLGGWVAGVPVITVAPGASSVGIHDISLYGQGGSDVLEATTISRTAGIVTVTANATVPAVLNPGMQVFLHGAGADITFNGLYNVSSISSVTQGGVTTYGSTFTYSEVASLSACSRASNVVTCSTAAPLPNNGATGFAVGTSVTVSGVADASYNGTFVLTATGNFQGTGTNYPASITYAQTGANSSTTGGNAYPANSTITPGLATDLGGGSGAIVSAVRTSNQLALTIAGPPIYGWGGSGQLQISGSSDSSLNGTWTISGFQPGANYIAVSNSGPNEMVSAGTLGDLMDKGIWIPNGNGINVERVNGFNFGDGMVDWESGEVLFLNQLNSTNCLQDVTSKRLRQLPSSPPSSGIVPAVSPMGCVVLNGTDGYMEYSEISTGSSALSSPTTVVDATLPSKAIVNGWNGINNWYEANIGELSDEGIWSGGQFNRWYLNRADLNAGTGIEDQSNTSSWIGNLALHDGSDQTVAPGQWYGIDETGGGQNQLGANVWTGNSVVDSAALAADIHDGRTSGSGTPNQWSNNFAQTYATPAGYSSSFNFPDNDFKQSLSGFTGVLGQNVSGLHNVLLQASSSGLSINNFTGGVPGQRIQVESNDGNTTLAPGDGYALRTCSGYQFTPLSGNGTTGFTLQGDYEMAWQMDCPQVAPWQMEGHGSLALLQTANPTQAATIGVNGTPGTSAYSYVCTQVNYQGLETLPTPVGSTTTGNATLSNSASNTVFCPAAGGTGLKYQKVYRTAVPTGSTLQLGFIGTANVLGFTGLNDIGQALVGSGQPPTVNHTADFSTQGTLSVGGGTAVTSTANIAQINQANTFSVAQAFGSGLTVGAAGQTTLDGVGNVTATGTAKLASVVGGGPRVDVRYYGAVGDGVTDNCTALTNAAAAAAGGVLYVPPLVFVTSCAVNLAVNGSLYIEPSGVLQAKAASALAAVVVAGATGFWTDQIITGGGTLDANNTALRALWLKRQYRGRLANLRMINATNYCLQNGDTADGFTGSNSMDAVEFWCYRTGSAIPAGSYGIWTDNATDSKYVQGYVKGYAEGVRDDVGGSRYGYLHVWDTNQSGSMTACFDDNAQGNWWSDNICDTPTQYGAILRSYNSHWSNNRFELNGTYGVTNTAIGFHSVNADPTSFFVGNELTATVTTGMVWAKDFDIIPVANMQTEFIANRPTYVTTKTVGTNDYLRSTNSFGSYKDFGAHTMNSANVVTWSATPTFTLGFENVQKLILTGNVTGSTWTSSGALQQFLVILCQNTTGGFTFNWGRVVGGGTPSTGPSSCSTQMFYDDGTAIRATGPMQVNE